METILNKESRAAIELMVADGIITKDTAERYFPELKESEDERIRKAIHIYLDWLDGRNKDYYPKGVYTIKDMIAWLKSRCQTFNKKDIDDAYLKGVCDAKHELEKQGKNNMGISEATKQELEDNLNKALEKETPESLGEFLEKQGEQKPVINMKTPEESLGIDSDAYNKIVDECIYGEQKSSETEKGVKGNERGIPISAWTKEDEKMYTATILTLAGFIGSEDKINWLKSLKDRVQPQPKQEWKQENTGNLTDFENAMMHIGSSFFGKNAGLDPNDTNAIKEQANLLLELVPKQGWSEEDEVKINRIVACLENLNVADNDILLKDVDWLKTLRPQTTWKPSEEQMEALKEAVDEHFDIDGGALWHLYEDLKKLLEE